MEITLHKAQRERTLANTTGAQNNGAELAHWIAAHDGPQKGTELVVFSKSPVQLFPDRLAAVANTSLGPLANPSLTPLSSPYSSGHPAPDGVSAGRCVFSQLFIVYLTRSASIIFQLYSDVVPKTAEKRAWQVDSLRSTPLLQGIHLSQSDSRIHDPGW
ncbi:4386_t:CDS:2, partial [Acaulospora colombiana]